MPRRAFRLQRMPIFVGCEGESEENYATFLHRFLDRSRRDRFIDGYSCGGGDPLTIVERAIARLAQLERIREPYRLRALLLDEHLRGQDPGRDARCDALIARHGLICVWQRPCFEGMLLRHFDGQQARRPATTIDAERALRAVWPAYRKPEPAIELDRRLDAESIARARIVEPELDDLLARIGF